MGAQILFQSGGQKQLDANQDANRNKQVIRRAASNGDRASSQEAQRQGRSTNNTRGHTQVEPFSAAARYSPSTMRSLDFANRQFSKQEAEIRADYQKAFEGLGLPKDLSEVAIIHISEIEQKRLQAQALLDEVEYYKADYDQIMRTSLGEQDYQNYRDLEAKKLQQAYIEDFNKHLEQEQIQNLRQDEVEELAGLLNSINGGVTVDKSKGPYGAPASINLAIFEEGTEQHYSEDKISLLSGERDFLLRSVSSDSLREAVQEYYSAQIKEYSDF